MKTDITSEEKTTILRLQATLTKIDNKQPCFFNLVQFLNMGLIKEHGKTFDNKTNWVLTEKARQILNIQL